jgi:O-antigen ligase
LFISAVVYAIDYSPSTPALILIGGVALGQGAAVWACFEVRSQKSEVRSILVFLVVSLLIILLALASVWPTTGRIFEYHSHVRWSGPWDNPNIYGLLMGTGAALAAGMGMRGWRMEDGGSKIANRGWKLEVRKYVPSLLYFIAAILMVRGLLHSYSRGAWLATFCGMSYLRYQVFRCQLSGFSKSEIGNRKSETLCSLWLKNNGLPIFAILLSVVVLFFWHFRQTEWHPAHRAFSAGNQNDFSWRNRIAAWEGALQITAEHPWLGAGWNQPEPLYEHYYILPKTADSAAIQMNDYLMLDSTLGIPALFCFGMYIWLSLTQKSETKIQNSELSSSILHPPSSTFLAITCRAGAIVLLVGFWFDGGLFKLATAFTFWILLELGSVTLATDEHR